MGVPPFNKEALIGALKEHAGAIAAVGAGAVASFLAYRCLVTLAPFQYRRRLVEMALGQRSWHRRSIRSPASRSEHFPRPGTTSMVWVRSPLSTGRTASWPARRAQRSRPAPLSPENLHSAPASARIGIAFQASLLLTLHECPPPSPLHDTHRSSLARSTGSTGVPTRWTPRGACSLPPFPSPSPTAMLTHTPLLLLPSRPPIPPSATNVVALHENSEHPKKSLLPLLLCGQGD